MENFENSPYYARKKKENKDTEKEAKKSPIIKTIIILITIVIIISLIFSWRENANERKVDTSEKQRQTYKERIITVSHKINAGETVYFDFNQMIKRRIVKIKGDGDGVHLDFEYFPSGSIGYYEDDHPDPKAKEYTDTGVYVTSSETITLNLSLL